MFSQGFKLEERICNEKELAQGGGGHMVNQERELEISRGIVGLGLWRREVGSVY